MLSHDKQRTNYCFSRHGLQHYYAKRIWPAFYASSYPWKNFCTGDFCAQVPQGLLIHWLEGCVLICSLSTILCAGTEIKENPTRPLILHTLPVKPNTQKETQTESEGGGKKRKLSPATNDVPRLISVVEIIKREFAGPALHQYNEIGCLEASESGGPFVAAEIPNEAGEERQTALQKALEGKH